MKRAAIGVLLSAPSTDDFAAGLGQCLVPREGPPNPRDLHHKHHGPAFSSAGTTYLPFATDSSNAFGVASCWILTTHN